MKFSSRQSSIYANSLSLGSLGALAITTSLFAFGSAHAHDAPGAHSDEVTVTKGAAQTGSQPSRNYVTANASGLVVALDRETGKARPLTSEEAQRLAAGIRALISQSTDGLVEVRHADGSVSMDLQGRFQSVMLAKKEDDGTISQACVDTPEAAAAFFDIDPELLGLLRSRVGKTWSKPLETR